MMFRLALLLLLVLAISVLALPDVLGFDINLPEREDLDRWIDAAGLTGPILVVALMTAAIVASPLPSARVALRIAKMPRYFWGTDVTEMWRLCGLF